MYVRRLLSIELKRKRQPMSEALKLARLRSQALRESGELIRLDPIQKAEANPHSLRAAINGKCWDCACGQRVEISNCRVTKCPLWNVRPYQRDAD